MQCAGTHVERRLVTSPATTLPHDGGFVVGDFSAPGLGTRRKGPAVWRAEVDGRSMKPGTVLAPGLVVFRAPSPARKLSIVEGTRVRGTARMTDGYGDTLPAPKLVSVVDAPFPEDIGSTTTVNLSAPAPADAIAAILVDDKGRPRTWGPVQPGARSIIVYDDRLCASLPAGTIEPSVGDRVTLLWVDSAGRPSAASNAVAVTR